MTEFDLISRMIDSEFLQVPDAEGEYILVETKVANGKKDHEVRTLTNGCVDSVALFRFALDEKEFLPFFNSTHDCPRHLRKFCDYVMLAHDGKKLNIVLLELKRSKKDPDEKQQLLASELFIRYIVDSAERIKLANNYKDFDHEHITIRKVCIKKYPGLKMTKRPSEILRNAQADDIVTLNNVTVFNPKWTF